MGCQVHRPVDVVTDVAAVEPAVQHAAVGGRGERPLSAGVGCRAREQVRAAARPAAQHAVLLDADLAFKKRCSSMGTAASRFILWLR